MVLSGDRTVTQSGVQVVAHTARRLAAKMPDGSRLQDVAQNVTHEARHLAAETHDGSSLPEALRHMAELVDKRGGDLAFSQFALSLRTRERRTPDTMFAAGRASAPAFGGPVG